MKAALIVEVPGRRVVRSRRLSVAQFLQVELLPAQRILHVSQTFPHLRNLPVFLSLLSYVWLSFQLFLLGLLE